MHIQPALALALLVACAAVHQMVVASGLGLGSTAAEREHSARRATFKQVAADGPAWACACALARA